MSSIQVAHALHGTAGNQWHGGLGLEHVCLGVTAHARSIPKDASGIRGVGAKKCQHRLQTQSTKVKQSTSTPSRPGRRILRPPLSSPPEFRRAAVRRLFRNSGLKRRRGNRGAQVSYLSLSSLRI